jgi:hypothetical protein
LASETLIENDLPTCEPISPERREAGCFYFELANAEWNESSSTDLEISENGNSLTLKIPS